MRDVEWISSRKAYLKDREGLLRRRDELNRAVRVNNDALRKLDKELLEGKVEKGKSLNSR
jgi:hypothetical protein